MPGSPGQHPDSRAAYIEDCNDDDHTPIPGTRQTANIAAKRSRPDIHKQKSFDQKRDEATISAASAQTALTINTSIMASRPSDVLQSSMKTSQRPAAGKERTSAFTERKPQTRPPSPEEENPLPLRRSVSRTHKHDDLRRGNFESRESAARMKVNPDTSSAARESAPKKQQPPKPSILQRSKSTRAVPVTQPVNITTSRPQSRLQVSSLQSTHSARPVSYHAGAEPMFLQQPQLQPLFTDYRPQPIYMNPSSYHTPSYQSNISYLPSPLHNSPQRQPIYPFQPTSFEHPSLIDQWQPPPHHPSPRRASMLVQQPIVDYPHLTHFQTALSVFQPQPPMRRRPSIQQSQELTPEELFYYEDTRGEDYYSMPPPPPPPVRPASSHHQQRPSLMRHAVTGPAAVQQPQIDRNFPELPRHHRTLSITQPSRQRAIRKQSVEEEQPRSRPSLVTRPSILSAATHHSHHSNGVTFKEELTTFPPTAPKLKLRPRSIYSSTNLERQVDHAEAYQKAKVEEESTVPLTTDAVNQLARRRTKTHSGEASEASSRASSSREGSKSKQSKPASRSSIDRHRDNSAEIKARKEESKDEGFTLSFNADQNVILKGDGVKDRRISLRPSRDGEGKMELSIGGRSESGRSETRTRQERPRDRSSRRYSGYSRIGTTKVIEEIAGADGRQQRSKSQVAGDGRKEIMEIKDPESHNNLMERPKRLGIPGSSRSRSAVSQRRMVESGGKVLGEGEPF